MVEAGSRGHRAHLELTDAEWMSIIDQERDGLPACCANISALRDELISTARNGGESVFYTNFDTLKMKLSWCFPDHEVPSDVITKIMVQVGWEPETAHEREREL